MQKLTKEEVVGLIESLGQEIIEFEWVRAHNKGEIRRRDSMTLAELKELVAESIEASHQPRG